MIRLPSASSAESQKSWLKPLRSTRAAPATGPVAIATFIIARPVSGKWSDRFGRAQVIIPGMLLLTIAMTLLAYATSIPWLLSVAALQGLGFGTVQPALMAFCVDRATDQDRGPALATLMMTATEHTMKYKVRSPSI